MVFFTGTLQEGIQAALQQSKLVVCFVTDGEEESKTWETEYLTDGSVAPSLEKDAVVLRLEAGSQEAGYLAAIFPLPKTPTLVIIKNGELKEYVAAGTAKDELLRRVGRAFSAQTGNTEGQAATSSTPAAETAAPAAETNSSTPSSGRAEQAPASASTSAGATTLLTEAERRSEAAREEREELERERRRKEKGKLPAGDDPTKARQSDAVKKASQQLAERQRQAREERARVLRLIEDDKAERRARQERERQERQAAMSGGHHADGGDAGVISGSGSATVPSVPDDADAAPSSPVGRRHDQCAIQVRLFDGSTVRSRFPAGATLARDVRRWIDEARTDGQSPYTFKVILTPQPNRAIDHAAEEERSLADLGLTPSATLVLTPVDRYSSAYTNVNAGLTNPVSRLVTAVLAFVMNILGGIAGALGGLGGSGARTDGGSADAPGMEDASGAARQDGNPQSSSAAQATGRDGGGRIKGFQNPDDSKKDYQLYNGNSVSPTPYEQEKCQDDKRR